MQTSALLKALLLVSIACFGSAQLPGGIEYAELTNDSIDLLNLVTRNESAYPSGELRRVCVVHPVSLQVRIVHGIEYHYNAKVCVFDRVIPDKICPLGCKAIPMTVVVWEKERRSDERIAEITRIFKSGLAPHPNGAENKDHHDGKKENLLGGLRDAEVTDEARTILNTATRDDKKYPSNNQQRVCVVQANSLKIQIVNGKMYHYNVDACAVDSVDAAADTCPEGCTPKPMKIAVWVHRWNDDEKSIQITEVTPIDANEEVAEPENAENLLGGLREEEVTEEARAILTTVTQDEKRYPASDKQRLCVVQAKSLKTQIVNGKNYFFEVDACVVDAVVKACPEGCTPSTWKIDVWVHRWNDEEKNAEITRITQEDAAENTKEEEAAPGALNSMPGGWSKSVITNDMKELIKKGLKSKERNLCVGSIEGAESQVVAGMKYKLHVAACVTTKSGNEKPCLCRLSPYVVTLYQGLGKQSKLQVNSVAPLNN